MKVKLTRLSSYSLSKRTLPAHSWSSGPSSTRTSLSYSFHQPAFIYSFNMPIPSQNILKKNLIYIFPHCINLLLSHSSFCQSLSLLAYLSNYSIHLFVPILDCIFYFHTNVSLSNAKDEYTLV